MSDAFKQQWLRTSAAKRLLVMLTAMAKEQGQLVFNLDKLEEVSFGEGVTQRFVNGQLIISYRDPEVVASEAEQTFIVEQVQAVERKVETKWPNSDDIPARLTEILNLDKARHPAPVMTTDDAEMAAREAQQQRTATQREAARRRDQPLPLTNPPMQS
jgi:hypothetical protein